MLEQNRPGHKWHADADDRSRVNHAECNAWSAGSDALVTTYVVATTGGHVFLHNRCIHEHFKGAKGVVASMASLSSWALALELTIPRCLW